MVAVCWYGVFLGPPAPTPFLHSSIPLSPPPPPQGRAAEKAAMAVHNKLNLHALPVRAYLDQTGLTGSSAFHRRQLVQSSRLPRLRRRLQLMPSLRGYQRHQDSKKKYNLLSFLRLDHMPNIRSSPQWSRSSSKGWRRSPALGTPVGAGSDESEEICSRRFFPPNTVVFF